MGLIRSHKLTKTFLMALETGTYLASNKFRHGQPERPVFQERVAELAARPAQWKRIKLAKVDGRVCNVYRCRGDHGKWTRAIYLH
jgi:hypothetical protein